MDLRIPIDPQLFLSAPEGTDPPQRLRRAVDGLAAFRTRYKTAYLLANEALAELRAAAEPDEKAIEQMDEVRRQLVLASRGVITRLEQTINEVVPGTFPLDDTPLTSGDVPCEAIAAAAGVAAAVGNLELAAALIGLLALAEISDACA